MWTTVHIVTSKENALEIKSKLEKIGFLVKIDYSNLDENNKFYEIIAPEFEAEDVKEAMLEIGII